VSEESQHSATGAPGEAASDYPPLSWSARRPDTARLGAPYPDRLDAANGCLFILLGAFAMSVGLTCLVAGADVPGWVYWPVGLGVGVALLGELRSAVRRARWRKVYEPIEAQLKSRDLSLEEAWGHRRGRLDEIGVICGVVRDHMDWPNDHFLPRDPLAIVLWNHVDTLSFTETLQEIEERFDLRPFRLIGRVKKNLQSRPDATFEDFVDWVLEEVDETAGGA
jgi:hypothetical protein